MQLINFSKLLAPVSVPKLKPSLIPGCDSQSLAILAWLSRSLLLEKLETQISTHTERLRESDLWFICAFHVF